MNACIKFIREFLKQTLPVRLWVVLLVTFNMVLPLLFMDRSEAQWVQAGIAVSLMLLTGIAGWAGITRPLGREHLVWVPLLSFLWISFDHIPVHDFYGICIQILIAVNATSLLLDAVDAIRHLAGSRGELVEGFHS